MRHTILMFVFVFIVLGSTACNQITKEDALELSSQAFKEVFSEEASQHNNETDVFYYYVPPGTTVEEVADTNIILQKGTQVFVIFSNPAEQASSRVNFEQDKDALSEEALLIEEVNSEEQFGYVIVAPFEKKEYKVTVGIGGNKGSTISTLANMETSVRTITEIVKSISYK